MGHAVYIFMALSLFLLFYLLIDTLTTSRQALDERLETIKAAEADEEDEMKKPFLERAVKPIYEGIVFLVTRLTPQKIRERYQTVITQAGFSMQMTANRLLVNQVLIALFLAALRFLLALYTAEAAPFWQYALLAVLGFVFPWFLVKGRADSRSKQIRSTLPDFLDMLYVSVEAGLSFDSAMKRTAGQMQGPLSEEILRAMDDIAKGRDREEALRGIGRRSQVKEVTGFVTAVIQSEILGSNIANMLRIQSNVMREGRRQRAEQEAAKMSTKMLFPLIFFMFPALFVVILGPAILNIIEVLSNVG